MTLSNMPSLAKVQEQQNGAVLKSRKFHGVRNDGELWVYHVLQIYQKLANDKSLVIRDELSDESKALFKKSSTLVEQLRKKVSYLYIHVNDPVILIKTHRPLILKVWNEDLRFFLCI